MKKLNQSQKIKQKGQALVTLLVFIAIAVVLTSAAVAITVSNTQGASEYAIAQEALGIAEGGAENAIIRLMRDPTYLSTAPGNSETITIGNGTAKITVTTSGQNITITSVGNEGDFIRTIQVTGTYSSTFTVNSWAEIN